MKLNLRHNRNGFTLVELIVVMAVFTFVIMIAGDTFKTVLSQTVKIFRSEESNIEGIVGLEILRHDLNEAGFGLFTETSPLPYSEATNAPVNNFNEATNTSPPRPIITGTIASLTSESSSGATYNILAGTDYISIKSTSVSQSNASKKWTYLKYVSGSGGEPNIWLSGKENFISGDNVLLMKREISASKNALSLVKNGSDFTFPYSTVGFTNYSTNVGNYIIYGLDNTGTIRRPFNRTDYFVSRPATASQVPPVCAPNTGILYKTVMDQDDTNGKLTYYPLIDCVADMQVVLMWDLMNGASAGHDGVVDTMSNADGSVVSGTASVADVQAALSDPTAIREGLKAVKVYILAQNGRKDTGYTSPSPILVGGAAEISLTRNYDIAAAGWLNYRWKLYQLIVRPKNLTANQ